MSCPNSGKIQYESQEDAGYALEKMRKKYPLNCNHEPYYCVYCNTWHLGRKDNPKKRKERELRWILRPEFIYVPMYLAMKLRLHWKFMSMANKHGSPPMAVVFGQMLRMSQFQRR